MRTVRLIWTRISHVPPRRFVFVATMPRSGGTVLCASMSETGVLGHPGEYFHREELLTREGLRTITYADCCALACWRGATANGIASSTVCWHQFDGLIRTVDIDRWFPRRSWIFLRRRDRVGQAISLAIATQTQQWNSKATVRGGVEYSRSMIEEKLAWLDAGNDSWNEFFSANKIEPLVIWYEDIDIDMHSAIADIARFVGGSDLEAQARHSPPFAARAFGHGLARQRTSLNDEWRDRFEGGGD